MPYRASGSGYPPDGGGSHPSRTVRVAEGARRILASMAEERYDRDVRNPSLSGRNPHRDGTSAGCCGPASSGTVGSLFGRECADCHATATWKIAGYKHPSPRSEDCAQCHQPPPSHNMGHFEVVSKTIAGQMSARVEQCHLCHQTDAWNDIKGVGWYKHH